MTAEANWTFPPYTELGPERLFRIESVPADGDGSRASMAPGPWVTAFDGSPSGGAHSAHWSTTAGASQWLATPPSAWPP